MQLRPDVTPCCGVAYDPPFSSSGGELAAWSSSNQRRRRQSVGSDGFCGGLGWINPTRVRLNQWCGA